MADFFSSLLYIKNKPLLFNSVLFFILFFFFYSLYLFVSKKIKLRNILLLLFSLYFYYKISGFAVIILIIISSSDYFLGLQIFKTPKEWKKKLFVFISVFINVGFLIFFKYINFLISSWFGIFIPEKEPIVLQILLPVGISFFVFKSLTYIFDIQREMIEEPERNYINYVLFVSFFPNIMAGPISKARDLLPQFSKPLQISNSMVSKGFLFILAGFFQKIFISDYLGANFIDRVFDAPQFFSGFENLMASYGAMLQIFFDFAGYTNIVIGLALLMGFTIAPNFNQPFVSGNITEFWRRWHITLSQWLNEYLFYPLSYSFRKYRKVGIIIAINITFFVSGLWHGANWTYVLWGMAHAIAMSWDVISQNFRDILKKKIPSVLYKIISIILTFHFLALSVIFFKSANLDSAFQVYSKIFTSLNFSVAGQWVMLYYKPFAVFVFAFVLHYLPLGWFDRMINAYSNLHWSLKACLFFIGVLIVFQAYSSDTQPFIYLEF